MGGGRGGGGGENCAYNVDVYAPINREYDLRLVLYQ